MSYELTLAGEAVKQLKSLKIGVENVERIGHDINTRGEGERSYAIRVNPRIRRDLTDVRHKLEFDGFSFSGDGGNSHDKTDHFCIFREHDYGKNIGKRKEFAIVERFYPKD